MKEIVLDFQGYTWDDYFFVISTKAGVLLTYKGRLDNEGKIVMEEILSIDKAEKFQTIYDGEHLAKIRKKLNPLDRLFFSYAKLTKDEADFVIQTIQNKKNNRETSIPDIYIKLKGACALLDKYLL